MVYGAMSIPEFHFKDADGIVEWHKTTVPESYVRYLEIKQRIRDSKFPGSAKLLKNVETNKTVTEFQSFLTELNLANLLLGKGVANLAYEPHEIPGVDFTFDDIALSVKNLHPKVYEKNEQTKINELQASGGGAINLTHKNFSDISIKVEKTEMGTYGWERTETGHSGFLDSDLYEMSAPLSYIGEFEATNTGKLKKVLFFFVQSAEFAHYYVTDIVAWYFNYSGYEHPIFQNDMGWYMKLFKQATKNDSVDALVFMFAPNTVLSWPDGCLGDVVDGKARLIVCTREKELHDRLKALFS